MKKIILCFSALLLLLFNGTEMAAQKTVNKTAAKHIEISMRRLSDAEWNEKLSAGASVLAKTGTCNDPANYQTTQIQFVSAVYSFNLSNSDAAISYSKVEVFGPIGFYGFVNIYGTYANQPFSGILGGLSPSTQYGWLARVTCYNASNTVIGVSTDATQVFTTKTCNQVFNPTTTVSGNSVTVSWAGGGGISEQSLQHRLNGTSAWTPAAPAFSTSKTISNLANGVYNLQITPRCKSDLSPFPIYPLPTVAGPNFTIAPPAPGGLTVTAVGYTSARYTWNAVAGATSYNVSYKLLSATTWTALGSTTTTSYTFPVGTLQMGKAYDVRVQAVAGGVASAFARTAAVPSFTTQNCNAVPSLQPASAIGFNRASLSWTGGTGLYNFQYKRYGATTWTNIQVSGSSYTLTGLVMGAVYNWQVQSICNNSPIAGDITTSAFSSATNGQFNTLFASAPAYVNNAGYGSFNSITPGWSAVSYAVNYDLIYRVKGTTAWNYINDIAGLTSPAIPGTQGTVFEVQVKTSCASSVDAAESAYSPITEMSVYTCGALRGSSVTNITGSSATLYATFSIFYGKGTAYDFRYKKTTDAAWTEAYNIPYVFVPDPLRDLCYTCDPYDDMHGATWNIGGLAAGTQYQWQVRTNCGSGVYSNWIDRGTFTTLAPACTGFVSSAQIEIYEQGCDGPYAAPTLWFWTTGVTNPAQYEIRRMCSTAPSLFVTTGYTGQLPSGTGDIIGIRVYSCAGATAPGPWRYISIAGIGTPTNGDPFYCDEQFIYPRSLGTTYNCSNGTVARTAGNVIAAEETPVPIVKRQTERLKNNNGLYLLPNPATREVMLNYRSDGIQAAEISITSLNGKPVYKSKINLLKGQNSNRIKLDGIVPGQYLLTLRMSNKLVTQKLTVIE